MASVCPTIAPASVTSWCPAAVWASPCGSSYEPDANGVIAGLHWNAQYTVL
ncbi:hypothetical protein M378DRAFT_166798 [Amanita muscaria Koide BX008]|uniref:Uncharacterized protein n=1 Tax=Amanita muscaria (strain Koide BX008) TaxID=946122 RepID=A0A0C2WJ37_AMAMK|nr:hypothetical protein M378DRAFT_166798 [Amanita muscaria Koide BX008]